MGDLSPHFSTSEFACRHCKAVRRPPASLIAVLERIRTIRGRPLVIISGYRCPEHNQAVGGAARSRHVVGDAADLPLGRATLKQAQAAGAVGVGTRGGWAVHVDVRPGPLVTWTYD